MPLPAPQPIVLADLDQPNEPERPGPEAGP